MHKVSRIVHLQELDSESLSRILQVPLSIAAAPGEDLSKDRFGCAQLPSKEFLGV